MIHNYLKEISKSTIALDAENYTSLEIEEQYIGKSPATDDAIEATEKRLGIKLPKDVIAFYKTGNGTSEILKQTFGDFTPIESIDWLKNIQPETIDAYAGMGDEYVENLKNSIIISGLNHPHQVFIIAPHGKNTNWQYWEFAHYIPGENSFNGIEKYLERLDDFLKDQLKNKNETIPTIYYGDLKEALQKQDWLQVYGISNGIILNNLQYPMYCPSPELFGTCLLGSYYLSNQQHYITFLNSLPQFAKNDRQLNTYLIEKYKTCAENKKQFFEDLQELNKFKPQQNPKNLLDIEEQIKANRKDLLKTEESIGKKNYQLHFLFEYGNANEFIRFYESCKYEDAYFDLLKTARVYMVVHQNEKALHCINKYIAENEAEKIMDVYLDAGLIKLFAK